MKVAVASVYADIPGKPSRLDEFLPLIRASIQALAVTNPDAKYIILTDVNTGDRLPMDVPRSIVAPVHMPLMLKIIFAQKLFVNTSLADLIVLPDVDCLANRSLEEAIPDEVGLAITHRGKKFEYSINNLAYVRDRELARWFFERAFRILKEWPLEKQEWEGDQEAWQAALAGDSVPSPPINATPLQRPRYNFEDLGNDHLMSCSEGRDIHLYPCYTHNCFMSVGGRIMPKHKEAYFIHFKGPRKEHLNMWMEQRFGV
jgi:hypothetical protein